MHLRSALVVGLAGALTIACTENESSEKAPAPAAETQAARQGREQATLLFTADIWGQLEPCGCSEDMRGGLDRVAAYVKERREAGPTLLVDAGDAFFDATTYSERDEGQARRRAQAVAQALSRMEVDAKARFELDRVFPVEGLEDERFLAGPRVLEAGGLQVGMVPVEAMAGSPEQALQAGVKAARTGGAELVVALVHAERQRVLALADAAQQAGADFVVGSHIESIVEGDEARMVAAGVPIFFTQARGQSLLQLEAVRRGEGPWQLAGNQAEREREIEALGERIRSYQNRVDALPEEADAAPFEKKIAELQARRRTLAEAEVEPPASGNYLAWRFVPVTEDRPEDPEVEKVLAAYDRDVAAANLAYARAHPQPCPEPAEGEASYVGGATCAGCHQEAHAVWKETAHGKAYATLEKAEKQYDLNCVSCHVTGWEKPGGACDIVQVQGRKDVTCESCHGPGSAHAAAPTRVKLQAQVQEATCRSCHTPEHSSAFDFDAYLGRILGPGHGQKAE